jgi:hypothetical protein
MPDFPTRDVTHFTGIEHGYCSVMLCSAGYKFQSARLEPALKRLSSVLIKKKKKKKGEDCLLPFDFNHVAWYWLARLNGHDV